MSNPEADDKSPLHPSTNLADIRNALVDVWNTLQNYPNRDKEYPELETILHLLRKGFAFDFERRLSSQLIYENPYFCWMLAHYILNLESRYSLGELCLQDPEKQKIFADQRKILFDTAEKACGIRAKDVCDIARDCSDFYIIDEDDLFYAIYRNTWLATSLEDAEKIAYEFVHNNRPPINYREVFDLLRIGSSSGKLFRSRQEIELYFPEPETWIGSAAFMALLQKAGISLKDFIRDYDSIMHSNENVLPGARITHKRIVIERMWKLLQFDPEKGCYWKEYWENGGGLWLFIAT